ncbi:hypothetical protein VTO73DRAFT_1700 [Trametes versicolor]
MSTHKVRPPGARHSYDRQTSQSIAISPETTLTRLTPRRAHTVPITITPIGVHHPLPRVTQPVLGPPLVTPPPPAAAATPLRRHLPPSGARGAEGPQRHVHRRGRPVSVSFGDVKKTLQPAPHPGAAVEERAARGTCERDIGRNHTPQVGRAVRGWVDGAGALRGVPARGTFTTLKESVAKCEPPNWEATYSAQGQALSIPARRRLNQPVVDVQRPGTGWDVQERSEHIAEDPGSFAVSEWVHPNIPMPPKRTSIPPMSRTDASTTYTDASTTYIDDSDGPTPSHDRHIAWFLVIPP